MSLRLYADAECHVPVSLLVIKAVAGKVSRTSIFLCNEGDGLVEEVEVSAALDVAKGLGLAGHLSEDARKRLALAYDGSSVRVAENGSIAELGEGEVREVVLEWVAGLDAPATRYYATVSVRGMQEEL